MVKQDDRLPFASIANFEIVLVQSRDDAAVLVGNRDIGTNDITAAAKDRRLLRLLLGWFLGLLRLGAGHADNRGRDENTDESANHGRLLHRARLQARRTAIQDPA